MKVYIGADHAGVALKEKIKELLDRKRIVYEDLGGFDSDSSDDYPDYAFKVGERVAKERNVLGVLICGTGTGMCIAVNKVRGIRAVLAYDLYSAKMARADNNANVLCLRVRGLSFEKNKKIVSAWLESNFSGKSNHLRRINKILRYEK